MIDGGALQSSDRSMMEFGVGQMRAAIIQSNARLLSFGELHVIYIGMR